MRGVTRQAVARLELDRRAHAAAEAVVDVLLHAEVRLHGVDVAGDAVEVRRDAQRGFVAERHVEAELDIAADAAAVDAADAELGEALRHAQLRLDS